MDWSWRLGLLGALVLALGVDARAQGRVQGSGQVGGVPESAFGTGVVTGHVTCGDTQRPARLATVSLVPKPLAKAAGAPAAADSNAVKSAEGKRSGQTEEKEEVALQVVQGKTGLDGNFAIGRLPGGDYYAVATMQGYVLALGDGQTGPDGVSAPDVNKVLANFPLVHVEADRSSSVELTMQRGGVITGRVVYEDGSPAANADVSATVSEGKDPMLQFLGGGLSQLRAGATVLRLQTDDEGRYRVAGLQPGKYVVSVNLNEGRGMMRMTGTTHSSMGSNDSEDQRQRPLVMYVPGVVRKSEAKVIEVHAGEVVSADDLLVNLSGLHHVSGRVLALSDRHPMENVGLFLSADKDFSAWGNAGADGSFRLDYVPDGTYTLRASGMDMKPGSKPGFTEIGHFYSLKGVSVVVAGQDLVMDDLLLPEHKIPKDENDDPE